MLLNDRKMMRTLSSALLGGALLLALGGCLREDENALVISGPDSTVAVAPLSTPAFLLPPEGTAEANQLELVSFDPTALDAFGRTTVRDSDEEWPYWRRWYDEGEWSVGRTLGVEGFLTAEEDARTPALTWAALDPLTDYDYFFMFLPGNGFGIGMNWFGEFCCATPGEKYVVGLVRAQLTVNGQLDAAQILLGQPVDQPDALDFLGGSPAGDYTFPAGNFDPTPAVANANPLLIGTVQACPAAAPYLPYSDTCANQGFDDGDLVIDFVFDPLNGVFPDGLEPTAENSPVAPNQATRFSLPSYNYLVIWSTNPDGTPDYSRPLTRVQLGVDLSPLGGPINNAYAPFPTAPLSDAELALGRGGVSRPDTVTMRVENLEELAAGATYQAFARLDDGSDQRLDFVYTNVRLKEPETVIVGTDTFTVSEDTLSGPTVTNSFVGGSDVHEVKVEFPDNATHVFLTIESDDDASPSPRQILWAEGLQEAGTAKGLDLDVKFGTFSELRTWSIGGTGSGGIFGDQFRVHYEQLPRPPVGYKYVAWLASGDTTFVRLPDETFTSPPPAYAVLESADTDTGISPVVQPLTILEAFTRICIGGASGCFDLSQYDTFILTLEPRLGQADTPSPTRVLAGLLP
jgi:hypothetical protein